MCIHKLFSLILEIGLNRDHSAGRRSSFTLTRTRFHMNIPAYNCNLFVIMSWKLILQWCLKYWQFLMCWYGTTLKKSLSLNHSFNLAWTRGELDHLNNYQLFKEKIAGLRAEWSGFKPCREWEFFSSLLCLDQLLGPPILLSNGYQRSFLEGQAARTWSLPLTSI
jgi:hypothetical protein